VGRDRIVAVYGDIGRGGVDIANGAHIAHPVGKPVATSWTSHHVNHLAIVSRRLGLQLAPSN
jgi:hypothetical protein